MRQFDNFDWIIFICALLLSGFGTAIIGSVSSTLVVAQVSFYVLGLVFFFLFLRVDFRVYGAVSLLIYVVFALLLFLTIIAGFESRGAIRWISVGAFRLQFSEIAKPFLVAALADFLVRFGAGKTFSRFLLLLSLMMVPIFFVLKQPDLGSALIYSITFLTMLFIDGWRLGYFFVIGIVSLVAAPLFWKLLASYQKQRILSFVGPGIDPLGASYNAIQAMVAVGSGLFLGRGLGRGTQSQLAFLPERHTDFIFASLSEELGFLGAATVLILYFVLIWRVFRIAFVTSDPFGKLFCAGVGVMLLSQVFINAGMNVGILPVTGITLPLVSYGGSSIVATMVALGMVENIARSVEIG